MRRYGRAARAGRSRGDGGRQTHQSVRLIIRVVECRWMVRSLAEYVNGRPPHEAELLAAVANNAAPDLVRVGVQNSVSCSGGGTSMAMSISNSCVRSVIARAPRWIKAWLPSLAPAPAHTATGA